MTKMEIVSEIYIIGWAFTNTTPEKLAKTRTKTQLLNMLADAKRFNALSKLYYAKQLPYQQQQKGV